MGAAITLLWDVRFSLVTLVLALSVPVLLATSCARKPPNPRIDSAAYAREIDQWHQQRWAELKSESGWLTLVGLTVAMFGNVVLGLVCAGSLIVFARRVRAPDVAAA